MSTHAHLLINAVPGIGAKAYLELGLADGATFAKVKAAKKASVDIAAVLSAVPTFQMTTDAYFEKHAELFDVVFIDACHEYHQVVRDLNNAIKCTKPGGFILLHDMLPPTEFYSQQRLCGDSFKLLLHLAETGAVPFKTFQKDFGLTVLQSHAAVCPSEHYATATFSDLQAAQEKGVVSPVSWTDMWTFVQGVRG